MIALFTCECGGAESLARKPLRRAGLKNWEEVPLYKGHKAKNMIKEWTELNPDNSTLQALYSHVAHSSRYAVVVGYDDKRIAWSDVARGDSASMIEAQVLLESFA